MIIVVTRVSVELKMSPKLSMPSPTTASDPETQPPKSLDTASPVLATMLIQAT